ncbi:hypothetical protein L7F22_011707 [Adiantum nelumboides]|nr:hypothetical protein [Adiantum nelumboides]
MRFSSSQERRLTRQPGTNCKGNNEDNRSKEANSASQTGLIVLRKNSCQNEFKILKMHEKEAYHNTGVAIRPLTLLVLTLLFLVAFLTITFPITTSFDSKEELLTTTKRQWESSSRHAKHTIKMWEGGHGRETRRKMMIEKHKNSSSTRSRSQYWKELTTILESLSPNRVNVPLKLGFINYNKGLTQGIENELWGLLTSVDVVPHFLPLQQVNQTWTWKDFYPEWIDEEEVFAVPKCPLLPTPELEPINTTLDVVYAEVPCDISSDWRRDVLRLYLQLSVARVSAKSNSSYVILSSACSPFPNLFTCKELVFKRGHLWLYKLDLPKLERSLALPVGSCELAFPLKRETSTRRSAGGEDKEVRIRNCLAFGGCVHVRCDRVGT